MVLKPFFLQKQNHKRKTTFGSTYSIPYDLLGVRSANNANITLISNHMSL